MDYSNFFNHKALKYDSYRPTYSKESLKYLYDQNIVNEKDIIADVGAGTGILTRALLDYGNTVIAIEPNHEMRSIAFENLKNYKNFQIISAIAEHTTLNPNSINVIFAGQAFHWFELNAFKKECYRILKEKKLVVLIWNRKQPECEMEKERQKIREKCCSIYDKYNNNWNLREQAIKLFYNNNYQYLSFDNTIKNTYDEFIGRALSDSRSPFPDTVEYIQYHLALDLYFKKYSEKDILITPNQTIVYWGYLQGESYEK